MSKFIEELKSRVEGEVRVDSISRKVYSVDASIYEVEPTAILLPKSREDIIEAIQVCASHNVPIIGRGAGTGITGGCLGKGLIIDTSKYLNRIITINYEEEYAICEPGVIQDTLNEALSEKGYRLGPNTSTGNRATLGGMVGNNSAGSHSPLYGKMVDHVLELELILSSGKAMHIQEGMELEVFNEIRENYREEIQDHFPDIPRRVSGYNLDELIKSGPFNPCKLIVGSEGTLGITTLIKVRICKKPKIAALRVLHFNTMIEGMEVINKILEINPNAVEMIDHHILEMGRASPTVKEKLGWLKGDPEAVFVVEVTDINHLEKLHFGYAQVTITDPDEMNNIWEVRKAGLSLLLSKRSYSRALAFIEDISVSPKELAPFMKEFQALLKNHGKEAGIYGHVGSGAMHLRPYMDLRDEHELKLMEIIMLEVTNLLLKHGGAISAEHGDGLLRSWLNKKMFGEKVYEAFLKLKEAFDPLHLMNPGKVVNGPPLTENLRLSPDSKPEELKTFLDFSKEGGFTLSADLCNGNGMCRKPTTLMCPSFQASGDEYDTTRARAQTLRSIIHRKLPVEAFTGKEMYKILDLCIECKGCKKECPSQVDMAKMKSEFLFQYQEKNGYSLRNRLIANLGLLNHLMAPFASLFNALPSKWLLDKLGISPKRQLPLLTTKRFSKRFQSEPESSKSVVLFNDTYTEFNHPEIGEAAVEVLHALGYSVILPKWECCGRPLISKGFLRQAKEKAEKLVDSLFPLAEKGYPIIILEPSCASALRDDYQGLLGYAHPKLKTVMNAATSLDEFLETHIKDGKLPFSSKTPQNIKFHGHCHQKALIGTSPTLKVINAISGCSVTEIPSGCCGMAGSFGYEKEHTDFSLKIGELHLFPAIRESAPDTQIIANGTSCRAQIGDGTGKKALHLAQLVARILHS